MSMLRRFEIYSVSTEAPPQAVAALARATRDCARYIPEVLHSAIGQVYSDTPLNFAWEQAYASPAAYRRYMEHPFHASLLDRFLMADSAERITTTNGLGVGLLGYRCETPIYRLPDGAARRVVALKVAADAEEALAAIAEAELGIGGMMLSVFRENYFAPRWFDGETWVGPEPVFGHLWEQGFPSMEAASAYGEPWRGRAGAMVERMVDVVYTVEAGFGYDR